MNALSDFSRFTERRQLPLVQVPGPSASCSKLGCAIGFEEAEIASTFDENVASAAAAAAAADDFLFFFFFFGGSHRSLSSAAMNRVFPHPGGPCTSCSAPRAVDVDAAAAAYSES